MARRPGRLRLLAVPRHSHTYYYLVRSLRQGTKVSTEYLLNYGPLTPEQALNLQAWVAGIQANPWAAPPAPTDFTKLEFEDNLPGFRHGIVALGHAIWRQLGFPTLLSEAFAGVKDKGFYSRLTEVMVLNRLEDPASKLRIAEEWYGRTTLPFLLGEGTVDEDNLYATLDVLDERRDRVEKLVYDRVVKPLDGEAGVFLKDLTSTYFEGEGVGGTLLAKGYSRDRVRGSMQVNWSVVLTPKGFPVTLEVYRGNTKDETTVAGTVERVKKIFGLEQGVFVGDRGMLTTDNLKLLHAKGFQYLVAETLWNVKEVLAEARTKKRELLEPEGKGKQKRLDVGTPPDGEENQEESWCEVIDEAGRRHLCIYSAAKEKEEIASLSENLVLGKELEKWARAGIQRGEWDEENHHDLVKSLTKKLVKADADTLFDVVWDPKTFGTLCVRVNPVRKAWEESKAGWWMLTTDTPLSAAQAVKLYKSLSVVERAFRTIKGPIKVRPVRHRLDRRIRAHLYVCLVAYLLERWLELKVREGGEEKWAHVTGERVLESLREGSVQQVGIRGTEIRRWKLARFSGEGGMMLDRVGMKQEVMRLPPMPTVLSAAQGG